MKKLLWISACLVAFASPVEAQQTPPKEYNLKVTTADLELMGKALGKLPFDDVFALMQSLRSQVINQQQEANKPVEVKPDGGENATTTPKP